MSNDQQESSGGRSGSREAVIAHQLRAPMASLMVSLQTILGGYAGGLTPQQRKLLEGMRRKARVLSRLSQEILEFESLAGGPAAMVFRPLDLRSLAEAVCQAHADRAEVNEIDLQCEFGDRPLGVMGSGEVLQEVLAELLTNAIKYTPRRGRVRFVTALSPDGDSVAVTVSDTGIGVTEDDRERVFGEFYRADNARRAEPDGTGMGLAMVARAVERHGGIVSLESEAGQGATFTITLPHVEVGVEEGEQRPAGRRVVVIGGVAAGPKVAAKISRLDPSARITIIERGALLAYMGCGLPYYISGRVKDQRELMSTAAGVLRDPIFFHKEKNVDVFNRTEALAIDREKRTVLVVDLISNERRRLSYDTLVLATGGRAVSSAFPGAGLENVFTLHGVEDAEGLRRALARGESRDTVIIGGGLLGCEIAEALHGRGARLTIVEKEDQILRLLDWEMAFIVEQALEAQTVRVKTGEQVLRFEGDGRLHQVVTTAGAIPAELAVLAAGVHPNVELAEEAGLEIGTTGAIKVDDHMRTSDPGIFAAGDCAEKRHRITGKPCYLPLGGTALKEARVAAVNICEGDEGFPGVLGTTALKVFDCNVARTGLSEREAREEGYDVETCLAPGPDRAHFYPTSRRIVLKLVADRATRRLLGVQAVGPGQGAKRIDIAAAAIAAGMTVDEVANLDLAYAPPYSEAMDNIITAANVLRNRLDKLVAGISARELKARIDRGDAVILIDVRSPAEYEEASLPKALSMPLGALRARVGSLPGDVAIVTFCDIGLRAYEAALILSHAGHENVLMLDGGLECWPYERA